MLYYRYRSDHLLNEFIEMESRENFMEKQFDQIPEGWQQIVRDNERDLAKIQLVRFPIGI